MAIREISAQLDAKGARVGIVVSRFNDFFTKQLLGGAIDALIRHGGKEEDITVVWVPGCNDAPLAADRLAALKRFDAVIVLGAVIDGATPHADLINSQVSRSLAQIGLSRSLPVINGVVTAHNLEQAIERSGSKAGNNGWKAALAAIEMIQVMRGLSA